jgi:hypothetical protein
LKDIFEEYGDFILQIIGGFAVLGIVFSLFSKNGLLNEALASVFNSVT